MVGGIIVKSRAIEVIVELGRVPESAVPGKHVRARSASFQQLCLDFEQITLGLETKRFGGCVAAAGILEDHPCRRLPYRHPAIDGKQGVIESRNRLSPWKGQPERLAELLSALLVDQVERFARRVLIVLQHPLGDNTTAVRKGNRKRIRFHNDLALGVIRLRLRRFGANSFGRLNG